jgi:hypothetical protein
MKLIISILGTLLIIFAIIGFSYRYFSYTTTEKVAEIGNVKLTAENEKVIVISPTVSAIMLGTGILLVILGLSRKL